MMPSASEGTEAAQPPPAKRDATRLFSSQSYKISKKRRKNALTFLHQGVNCVLETGSALTKSVFRAHFIGYFSKRKRESAKLQNMLFCSQTSKYQQGPLCLRVLLGVSLSFWEQVLGGTHVFTHGDASGFFLFFRLLPTFFPKAIRKLSGMTKKVVPFKCLSIYENRT